MFSVIFLYFFHQFAVNSVEIISICHKRYHKTKDMARVGELVKEGFARIKESSLKRLVKKVEKQEIEYYELANPNILVLTNEHLYDEDSDTDEEELDSDEDIGVAIDGGAMSDLEEEDNNPLSDDDE